MKKLSLILTVCTALAGCSHMDPNLDSAQASRDANRDAYRQEFGCPFTDDHASYRDCLLNTYYSSKPKTYSTTTNKDGKSVAVIKDETKNSYDKETNTYKTERVIVIETEERLVPMPIPSPIPEVKTETVTEEVALTTEENGEANTLIESTSTTQEIVPVEPKPEPTWWDTYQEEKEEVKPEEPVCPCPDPNAPCPQCVDK